MPAEPILLRSAGNVVAESSKILWSAGNVVAESSLVPSGNVVAESSLGPSGNVVAESSLGPAGNVVSEFLLLWSLTSRGDSSPGREPETPSFSDGGTRGQTRI